MTGASPEVVLQALSLRYLLDFPREAAGQLERLSSEQIAAQLAAQPVHAVVPVWEELATDVEETVLGLLPPELQVKLLSECEPGRSAGLLLRLEPDERDRYLKLLPTSIRIELEQMMAYAPDSAGQLMDPRVVAMHPEMRVADALARLREKKARDLREIYVIGELGELIGRVPVLELAVASPEQTLLPLMRETGVTVQDTAPRDEVVELFQKTAATDLPVVDAAQRLLGVLSQDRMINAVRAEASTDIQTMVGASPDERATSSAIFAVRKRLPWLQINLLTAFLAAAVVGLFEGTVAKFTALAVLLPVVAGQSGNAGAQALAVTMRGLVLREISLRHWPRMVIKEVSVGMMNGVAVALTTAIGVYLWSRSTGLVIIIASAMVISMIAAGFAGALVPILLRRFGQDPASSSSIILTTVTDVVGFFSFLGIATLFSGLLETG